jgi:hypothetical protein
MNLQKRGAHKEKPAIKSEQKENLHIIERNRK